jgi:hypothetical protein
MSCRPSTIQVPDLDGHLVDPLAAPLSVLIFASPGCPISDRYAPEVQRLHARFAPRGASFHLVYAGRDEPVEALRRHAREYGYPFPALRDFAHALGARSRVTIAPAAAVFSGGRLVYHGRIDDRMIDFGKERPAPTRRELADALEAVLAGRPVAVGSAPALGCAIP